jgi:hypothetical protein
MNHEVKLSTPPANSYPCLLCPFCSSEEVEITSRPKRNNDESEAGEIVIGFGCLSGHSWDWVLSDWEGRIFFSVKENKQRREPSTGFF